MTVEQALELLYAASCSALLNKQVHMNVQRAYEILKAHLEFTSNQTTEKKSGPT